MTPIASSIGFPYDSLASQCPIRHSVCISATGQVDDTLTVNADNCNILVVPSSLLYRTRQNPSAVGRPFEIEIPISIREIVTGRKDSDDLSCLHIHHPDFRLIGNKGYLFPVGRIFGHDAGSVSLCKSFFLNICSISKILVSLIDQATSVDITLSVALGSIDNAPSIRTETRKSLHTGSRGNATCCLILHCLGVDISVDRKNNFLLCLVNIKRNHLSRQDLGLLYQFVVIHSDADIYLDGELSLRQSIKTPIPRVAQSSIVGH